MKICNCVVKLPFGEDLATAQRTIQLGYAADTTRQRFTGYQKDTESGLDYAKARMYGGSYGRFTSPDPLMASAKAINPQSWNRYIYVGNNPLNLTDPSGLSPVYFKKNKDGTVTYRNYEGEGFKRYKGSAQTFDSNGSRYRVTSSGITNLHAIPSG